MELKQEVVNLLKKELPLKESEILNLLESPPDSNLGDISLPCFQLSKILRKDPKIISQELKSKLKTSKTIKEIKVIGPYLNFYFNPEFIAKLTLKSLKDLPKKRKETVIIDYSQPNIAKPFGIGHLRSTVIGQALYNIYKYLGYTVVGINHLGDYGTQFGKEIYAFKRWGSLKKLKKEGIKHLLDLYVKFHEEAEKDTDLEDQGRLWFKRLEDNNKEALKLFKLFKAISLKEFQRIYKILNIKFDSWAGEYFYKDMLQTTIEAIKSKNLTKIDEGALIVDLSSFNLPPLILSKSDEASTYATRDLAAAFYRLKHYKPKKILYVVDKRQTLHFQQLFKTLGLYGVDTKIFEHIKFGMMSFEGKVLATRKGHIILLEKVLNECISKAEKIIKEKNPKIKNLKNTAKTIGLGALIFFDLSNDRTRDIDFNWDKALNFEGDTGPYVQYTYVRCCSLLNKAKSQKTPDFTTIKTEKDLILLLSKFKETVEKSATEYKPSILANYLLTLSGSFNEFYEKTPILKSQEPLKSTRIEIVKAVKYVLSFGLNLLHIDSPEEM